MVRATSVLMMGLVAGMTYAQESTSTVDPGPLFDPSNAPFFGYSSVVFPTQTPEVLLPPTITAEFSVATTLSLPLATLSRSTTRNSTSHSASHSANSTTRSTSLSTSSTVSRTSLVTSSTQRSSATSASATATESAGAASSYQGVFGMVVGGLIAGLAAI